MGRDPRPADGPLDSDRSAADRAVATSGGRLRLTLAWWVFACSAAGFVVLSVCVELGLVDGLDRQVFDLGRPGDVWGPVQMRSVYVVDGLRPPVVAVLLTAVTLMVCLMRRTVRPAALAAGTVAVATAATGLIKLTLARPDPHAALAGHGGSYPSGHTLGVVVGIGLAFYVIRPDSRWWSLLTSVALGFVMGAALIIEGAHWASDVAGGLLLGIAVLAAVAESGLVRWSAVPAGSGRRSA